MQESTETMPTELEERLRFERLLAELSAHFVNLPASQIDSNIEDAQRHLCELLDLDRSALFQLSEGEPRVMVLTCQHQHNGRSPLCRFSLSGGSAETVHSRRAQENGRQDCRVWRCGRNPGHEAHQPLCPNANAGHIPTGKS